MTSSTPSRHYSTPQNVKDAHRNIVYFCKNGTFADAEQTFQKMCEMIKFQPVPTATIDPPLGNSDDKLEESNNNHQEKQYFSNIQIERFQKSTSTIVRYAPTIQDSLDYACFCLCQVPEPLRDESLEKILTTNLIYRYRREGGRDNFEKALDLIKTGVTLGYGLPLETSSYFTSNSDEVFFSVSAPVLRYFGLNISSDKRYII